MANPPFLPDQVRVGYYKAPPVDAVKPLVIPARTLVVELVTKGTVYYQVGTEDQTLGCGALFWHVFGEETICRTTPSDPYECLALAFSVPARFTRPMPRLTLIRDRQRAIDLSAELHQAYQDDRIDSRALSHYAYSCLLWEAYRGSLPIPGTLHPQAIEAALQYIEAHFRQPEVSVESIARHSSISVPHLHALFRQCLKQTPHQFLTARRLREAKWLLTGTDQTIKSIAAQSGYFNLETFYRAFAKAVGTTPHQFRQNGEARTVWRALSQE